MRSSPANAMPGATGYGAFCDAAAEGMRKAGAFAEPEQWQFDWERYYTRAEWLDLAPTSGGFSRIPSGKQQQLLKGIGDAIGDGFTMSYATVAVTATLG